MNINTDDLKKLIAEAESALGSIEALATTFGPFLPASVKTALVEIKMFQAAAPTLIAEVEKLVADAEAAYATFKSAQAGQVPAQGQ